MKERMVRDSKEPVNYRRREGVRGSRSIMTSMMRMKGVVTRAGVVLERRGLGFTRTRRNRFERRSAYSRVQRESRSWWWWELRVIFVTSSRTIRGRRTTVWLHFAVTRTSVFFLTTREGFWTWTLSLTRGKTKFD